MKTLLYTLTLLMLVASCRSIETLIDKGDYDEAIIVATKRLAGKKNKKTKHVKYLEEAFVKITDRDMDLIHSLDAENNPYNWERVLALSQKIEKRQNRIKAFLPLTSKDGYNANFQFVKASVLKNRALDGAAEFHYSNARSILDEALSTRDKLLAKKAYYAFKEVEDFRIGYKDVNELKKLSRLSGIVEVLVDLDDRNILSREEDILLTEFQILSVTDLNDFWTNYSFEFDSLTDYDLIAKFEILDLFVSPEREVVNRHVDKKKIKDGWEYVKKKTGEIKTDSLGNKIKRDVFRTVKARVTEITRDKSSLVEAQLTIWDAKSSKRIDIIPFSEELHFSDYSLRFNGDRRALCDHDIGRIDHTPLVFPTDLDMIMQAGLNMKHGLVHELRDIRLN